MARNKHFFLIALICWFSIVANGENGSLSPREQLPVPSHADAAVIFARYCGLFDRYVPDDASLNECVSFLNKTGIYFGLLEVVNGTTFTLQDCARVMGQMNLVFSGEAEYVAGKVKLPLGVESWEDFCILNDVKYIQGYENLVTTLDMLHKLSR